MKRIIKIAEHYSTLAEDLNIPFGYFILAFMSFVAIRNLLEIFSDGSKMAVITFDGHFHFYLFYACMALTMMLLFSALTGVHMNKIARLILFSFFFIFLAPILDLLISGGRGYNMAYLLPDKHGDLPLRYLTFAGAFHTMGITIGLKIEVAVMTIASFFYCKAKKMSTLKSLLSAWLMYTLIFIYAIVPFIIKAILDVFDLFEYFDSLLFAKFYLVLFFFLLLAVAYKWNNKIFNSLLDDVRPWRQMHALMMFVFGIILGPSLAWNQRTFFDIPVTMISILWACLFVIMTNNLHDQEIDRWVNKKRPLINKTIAHGDYQNFAVGAGLLALAYAWVAGYYVFFTILLFMGLYSLYSMPPLRLKRVPFFSKLVIAVNSLAFAIMGYVLAGGEVIEFPPLVILWFLVFLTAAMNFIDLKDYKGDKRAGIQTLPVMWGLEKSQRVIGVFFLLAYLVAPLAVGEMILLIPAIPAGAIQYWTITRKRYREQPVFSLYLTSFAVMLIILAL